MATYIQGIQDYIPQIQPFKPDFNFFQSALEQKQQQYQAGYNKISAVYGQLLNSELLRDANKERRDALFTEIDSDIKRLSGVDLSRQENVTEASKLFQPLISNDFFRKDVAFTKQYYAQLKRADGLQRSPDPKSDERYWQEGVTALHYQAEDFSKATDDESMRYRNPLYTPKIDTTEKLFKFAKDNDINPESDPIRSGGYIYKYTNGKPAIPTLQNTFSSVLMSDPRIKAMTDTEAYLERKNYSKENATRFGGDQMAAETEYLQNKITDINKYYAEATKQTEEKANRVNTTKKVIEDRIATYGIDPDLDQDLVKMYQGTMTDQSVVANNEQKNKDVTSQIDGIDMNSLDRESLRYRVDNAMSYFKIDGLAARTAEQYAMSKQKVDFQVDQYALENTKHRYKMIQQDDQQQFDKNMKMMDIATEMFKASGNGQAGNSLNPFYGTGLLLQIPGAGGVTTDNIDIQRGNEAVAQTKLNQNTELVDTNIEDFLAIQNSIIKNTGATPEQKAKAEQDIKDKLGEFQIEDKIPASTKTEYGDLTDQGSLTDIAKTIGGIAMTPGIQAVPIIGPLLGVIGAGARVAGAAGLAGPGLAGQGAMNIYGEAAGKEVTTPEVLTKTKGLVVKNANGTYDLVPQAQRTHFTDPASESYYNNVNKKVLDGLNETYALYKGTPYEGIIREKINQTASRQQKLDTNNEVLNGVKKIVSENNQMLGAAMANEAGTTAENAKLYWKPDLTGSRTENEFVTAYIEANKNNLSSYPKNDTSFLQYVVGSTLSDFTGDRTYGSEVSEEDRLADMREDAIDMYEELTEAHQTLAKNPDGNLNIKSVFDDGLVADEGINRFYTNAAYYGFDAALWNTPSFSMAMDFFQKDFIPKTASPTFRDENGVKIVYGSGLDITKDEYAEMEHDPKAELLLKTFLASSSMNYGGKTGENQMRPNGAYYLSAVAANDANKVAMTWEFGPDWIEKHAGNEDNPGPAYELQQRFAKEIKEGGIPDYKVTFFMDADKAQSSPFQAMQLSNEEMLMNMNGSITLDAHSKYGGDMTVSRNALGGYAYNGYMKAVDELGNTLSNPIFGTSDSDLNSMTQYFGQLMAAGAMSNMQQEAALRNQQNLQFDPTAVLETE